MFDNNSYVERLVKFDVIVILTRPFLSAVWRALKSQTRWFGQSSATEMYSHPSKLAKYTLKKHQLRSMNFTQILNR